MFLYHDIQWGEDTSTIGFYAGDGIRSFTLSDRNTTNNDPFNLSSSSNVEIPVEIPGAYFFRVDQDEVILPTARGIIIIFRLQLGLNSRALN